MFALVPVALNSIVLVGLGLLFHKLSRHSYPHRPKPAAANTHRTQDIAPELRAGFRPEDVDAALADVGEAFDIDREDLDRLLRQVELRALARSQGGLTCADIMSRDVISIASSASPDEARALLLEHNIRTLPVLGEDGALLGTVGLRELSRSADHVSDITTPAVTAAAATAALNLIATLTDGRTHAVVITDEDRKILGLVTQTDLLTTLSRLPGLRVG
jgi:CBS domain-containing membrane protein